MMLSMTNANMRGQLPFFIRYWMFAALRKRALPEGTRRETSLSMPATGDCPALVLLFFSHPPAAPVLLSSSPRRACKTSTATPHPHTPLPPSTHGRPWLVGNFWACTSTGSWREYPGTSCNWICSARPDLPCALGGHPTHPPPTKAPQQPGLQLHTPIRSPPPPPSLSPSCVCTTTPIHHRPPNSAQLCQTFRLCLSQKPIRSRTIDTPSTRRRLCSPPETARPRRRAQRTQTARPHPNRSTTTASISSTGANSPILIDIR